MAHKDNDISNLIPDYSNNRLDTNEKADFESLLLKDHELLDERNDFQEFQNLYHKIDPAEPSPSSAIFDRISQKINVHQKVERKEPAQSNLLAESLHYYWQKIRESVTMPWILAAAQTVVIVILLMPAHQQNTYSTLSATKVTANTEEISINVVFQPNAMESDIRSLLHSIQGSVSNGPSREGRYVVSISSQNDIDEALRTLKLSKFVLFAEPLS